MSWNFPVFLDLRGRPCAVIGSGWSAPDKVNGLLRAGAAVTVIAAEAAPEIDATAERGDIVRIRREYRAGDMAAFFLAVATHEDRARNEALWRESVERNILFNAVDDPPHCGFSYPAIHRQGDLMIAVSTSGKAPAVGVRVRDRIAAGFGEEYGALVRILGEMRAHIAAIEPDFARRKELWYRLVDSEALARLRAGDELGARDELWEIVRGAGERQAGSTETLALREA